MREAAVFQTFLTLRPNSITRTRQMVQRSASARRSIILRSSIPIVTLQEHCIGDTSEALPTIGGKRSTLGIISPSARKAINTAVDWMLLLSKEKHSLSHSNGKFFKWRLNFVTLTLASKQIHSDNAIKSELLNHFLIECKKYYGTRNYIWRAEAQKNGNIHFHIIFDKFIPWRDLRDRWNRIQNKLGYVDRFAEKFNHTNPNGTDVHSIGNIKNLGAYFSKYLTKNQIEKGYRAIDGRLWGLSQQLSKLDHYTIEETNNVTLEFANAAYFDRGNYREGKYHQSIYLSVKQWCSFGMLEITERLRNFVKKIIFDGVQEKILPLPQV